MKDIKNIIFDLGGVILNIDIRKTAMALEQLGVKDLQAHLSRPSLVSFFNEYESGKIDDNAFVAKLQSLAAEGTTGQNIVDAWNALLLDFPAERIELLRSLRKKYRLFLLSNTNAIHYNKFQEQIYLQTGNFYVGLGNWDEATRLFQEGLKHDPKNRLVYHKRLTAVLLAQDKKEEAARMVDMILGEAPNDEESRRMRALLLLDAQKPDHLDEAVAEFSAEAKKNPNDLVARYNLARSYVNEGRLDQARMELIGILDQNVARD